MRTKLFTCLTTVGTASLALISFSTIALAAPSTCTVSSIQLVGATPGTIDNNGSVTAGTPVTVRGKVTESGLSDSGCTAGTGGAAVTEGTLQIDGQKNDLGPIPCKDPGVGAFNTLASQDVATDGNIINHPFSTTGLDETRGFRTQYIKAGGGSFTSSTSVCVDLTINPSANPCDAYDDVVVLNILGGAGKGIVAPGDVGPWSYTFEVLNCTGIDDLAVKVQGGTSGWTVFESASTDPAVGETFTVIGKSKGKKGTTSTITWPTILDDEESKTMTVLVNGVVPSNVFDGEWINLSGAWSAAYTDSLGFPAKSQYTPQVYLEVDLP